MEIRTTVFMAILGAALVTVIPRVLPLVVLSRAQLSDSVVRWLSFVPIAVLAALLGQSVLLSDGQIRLPPQNLAPLAIVPALLVALLTRSLIGTVLAGVVAMALLRLVM